MYESSRFISIIFSLVSSNLLINLLTSILRILLISQASSFIHEVSIEKVMQQFSGACRASCPIGYGADKKRRECVPCPPGCATCDMSTCRSCDDGWSLNEEGLCAPEHRDRCKTTEFYENGHCKQCHASCKTCAGPGENNCISCQKPLLLQAKRCVYQCDDGYYSMAQPSGPVCVPCLHTCKTCVSRLNCTACQDGLQLQSGECRSSCAQGWVRFPSCHTPCNSNLSDLQLGQTNELTENLNFKF